MIIFVGPLPPPVHGASSVTQQIKLILESEGIGHVVCSTSPGSLKRGLGYHSNRAFAFLRAILTILKSPRGSGVYLSVSGGLGLIYETFVATAARVRGFNLLIHHHSFAYLSKPSWIMGTLVWISGARQSHIALCQHMGFLLRKTYPGAGHVEIISNGAYWADTPTIALKDHELKCIGFLSNVTLEKGVDRFIHLVEVLSGSGWQGTAVIAGPVADESLASEIGKAERRLPQLYYLGPVYGDDREVFFEKLDLLVFPTRYVNEAEPLAILEAQQRGIPVAASCRGCISDMVGEAEGLLLDSNSDEISPLAARILHLSTNADDMMSLREATLARVHARAKTNRSSRHRLTEILRRLAKGKN
jgi:glycosyltransferase involved in cell wall biosynthesis